MLPRPLRLTRQGFENAKGLRRIASPHFSISYGQIPGPGGSAIIVPKKVLKSAVARHLLKRRVRAAIRPWSATDHTLIISARSGAGSLPYSELESELSGVLTVILSEQA